MTRRPAASNKEPQRPEARPVKSAEPFPMTMTREEVAEALQVTTKTVDNLWRRGELPRPSRIGRGVRFLRSEIRRFLEERRA